AAPLRVQGSYQSLAPHLGVRHDPEGSLTIQAVHATGSTGFQPLPNSASFGFRQGGIWLRFQLDWDGTQGERWLELPTALLDHADLYRLDAQGQWLLLPNGRSVPFSRRSLPLHQPTFRLPPGNGVEVCYLHVASEGAMEVDPVLWEPANYAAHATKEQFWFGLGAGLLLLLALTHLSIAQRLRNKVSLLYACYAGVSLSFMLSYDGAFSALVVPEHPRIDYWVVAVSFPAFLALLWPLFSSIVGFQTRAPRLDRAMTRGTLAVGLAGAAARLAGQNHLVGPLLTVSFLCLLAWLVILACWLVLQGSISARFYLLAFIPVLIPLGYYLALNLGAPPMNLLTTYAFDFAAYTHVAALNLPVAARLFQIKRERDEALARELQISHHNERQLEALVGVRTADLGVAKERAEQALITAQEVLEGQRRLIRTVSHEFRTPLAVIDGTAQLLELQGEPSPPGQPSPATTIRAKVQKLLGFLDGALRQDQLESGHWRMTREALEPEALLQTVLAGVDADPAIHPIELRLERLPGTIFADPKMLAILLGNLLENAIRYSPRGGGVVVTAEALAHGAVRITVSDQGIGIPVDQLPRVFDRFYRTGQLQGVDGSGLGLYLSREIARMHGGELSVESVLGQGSRFTLLLPAEGGV
ncbi:MAG: sensor histidine kinase, partial [Holophagaceae bacterium]|nr:sensor histidine kinase [Holophagaceae bacterium]